jgi:hypothetical protein
MRRKPTRRDLLVVIGRLQDLVGRVGTAMNDRNPRRADDVAESLGAAHQLCVDARSYDDPINDRHGPWGDDG